MPLSSKELKIYHSLKGEDQRCAFLVMLMYPGNSSEFIEHVFALPTGTVDEVNRAIEGVVGGQ